MDPIELGQKPSRKGLLKKISLIVALAAVVAGSVFLAPRFEWNAPTVRIAPDSEFIGTAPLEIEIAEKGRGLQSVTVTLSAGGAERELAAEQFGPGVMDKKLTIALAPKEGGIEEGPAVLRVTARDRSYWSFLRGNRTIVEKKVVIDVTPPALEWIADDAYVNFGGSGVLLYKTSSDAVLSGVKIGDYFFPGYKAPGKDPAAHIVFFAHPYNVPEREKAALVAEDRAGNSRRLAVSYTLKNVRYRKSTIQVSDRFIEDKVAPLLGNAASRPADLKEIFVKVNRGLRKENEDKIREICRTTAGSMLWSRPFVQLANSKVEANFADERTYAYQDENIDHAYHLGFDLAVTKRHPVGAANDGVVAFAGDLGIYGNTVVIDHGLGLFTLYSHLSTIDVKAGERLQQRQTIGKTGETGLAAGDHLHFATLLHGVPVLPLEWWDEKWIRDNILDKLAELRGEKVAAETPPRPARRSRARSAAR